jgi:hypothetical protein
MSNKQAVQDDGTGYGVARTVDRYDMLRHAVRVAYAAGMHQGVRMALAPLVGRVVLLENVDITSDMLDAISTDNGIEREAIAALYPLVAEAMARGGQP